ncbi:MAG: hypothetical protein ABIG28_03360 [archaeon]
MVQQQVSLQQIYAKLLQLEHSMKKLDKVDQYIEDLEFARRTEEAYQRHEAGDFKVKPAKEFLKELKQW